MHSPKETQSLVVSHHLLSVYRPGISNPFPEWTQADRQRGYHTGNGRFTVGALSNWTAHIHVSLWDEARPEEGAVRSLVVPFQVGEEGVAVASVQSQEWTYPVPRGTYALVFHAIPLVETPPASGLYPVRYDFQWVPARQPAEKVWVWEKF